MGGDRKAFADLISTENQTNPFKKGARVYQEVFNKLWAKGNVPPALDRMLSENNFLPWHMCNAAGFAYTPGKVKGSDGAVSLTHCRELFDIMLKQKNINSKILRVDPDKRPPAPSSMTDAHDAIREFLFDDPLQAGHYLMKGVAMSALNASWDRVQKKARCAWYRVHGLEEERASLVEELKAQEQDPSIDQKKTTEMLRQLMKVTHTLQSEKEIFVYGASKVELDKMSSEFEDIVQRLKGDKGG